MDPLATTLSVALEVTTSGLTSGLARGADEIKSFGANVQSSVAGAASSLSTVGTSATKMAESTQAATGLSSKAFSKLQDVASLEVGRIGSRFGVAGREIASSIQEWITGMTLAGTATVAAGAVIGAAFVKMAVDGVESFATMGEQVNLLMHTTGATASQAGTILQLFGLYNIDAQTAGQSLVFLNTQIRDHADVLAADGIQIARNADGTTNLVETLYNVGDAYKKAGGGAEGLSVVTDALNRRTALQLVPLLALSRSELEKLTRQVQDHFNWTNADVRKAEEALVASRNLKEAFAGLEMELGRILVPVLTLVADGLGGIIDKAHEAATAIGGFWDHIPDALKTIIKEGALGALKADFRAGPIATGLDAGHTWAAAHGMPSGGNTPAGPSPASLVEQAAAAQRAADVLTAFNKSVDDYVKSQSGAESAGNGFATQLIALATSLRDNGTGFDLATTAGLKNQSMLEGLVAQAAAVVKAGGATGDSLEVMAGQLYNTAVAYGIPAAEAEKYANQIRGLKALVESMPQSVVTIVDIETGLAMQHLNELAVYASSLANSNPMLAGLLNATNYLNVKADTITKLGGQGAMPDPPKPVKASGGSSGADTAVADYLKSLEDARKQQQQVEDFQYAHSFITEEKYRQLLMDRLANAQTFSTDWQAALEQIDKIDQQDADRAAAAVEAQKKAVADRQSVEDNMAAAGAISNDQYRAVLVARLGLYSQYSDDWEAVNAKIAQIDQQAQQARDDAHTKLVDQLTAEGQALATRIDQLNSWTDATQRASVAWGSSATALTTNIASQTAQMVEWSKDLGLLAARGLSSGTISLLGLDKGPQALGQERALLSASSSQLAGLNAATAGRESFATGQAMFEQGISTAQLAAITAAVPTINIAPPQVTVNVTVGKQQIVDVVNQRLGEIQNQTQVTGSTP